MEIRRLALFVTLIAIVSSSCVTRTTSRSPTINEISSGKSGAQTESKTIWFWQKEFREP